MKTTVQATVYKTQLETQPVIAELVAMESITWCVLTTKGG